MHRGWQAADVPVQGHADEGFGPVADAFAGNWAERDELGAACAVVHDGRLVVDLWGGHRDPHRTRPWERDTMVPVFSTTKGMAAAALAVAHSRGLFRLDRPVTDHWPEFGAGGKEDVTVRQLLTHRAGLAAVDTPVDLDLLADHDRLGEVLAAQVPAWPPGERQGYHAVSLGWYGSQLLRRVDPAGRTLGRFFADEVAGPLGVDFHIGLPDDVPDERLATLVGGRPLAALLHLHELPVRFALALAVPWTLSGRAFRNPKALGQVADLNRREILRVELPSANGTGTARAIASVYGALAAGGGSLGVGRGTLDELEAPAADDWDVVLKDRTAYAFGVMKPCPTVPFGSSPRCYGHGGVGGSMGFADPDRGVGYAYVMNRGGFSDPFDPRDIALRTALDRSLDRALG